MKTLDPKELAQAADAHEEWMQSEDWQRPGGTSGDDEVIAALAAIEESMGGSPEDEPERQRIVRRPPPDAEILPRLDAMDERLMTLFEAVGQLRIERPEAEVPRWLLAAAGDPQSYDAPDPDRMGVGWRVHPATNARIKQVQAGLGLRTLAGTLECVLRMGLAAAARLPGGVPARLGSA
ncbi:MAG: hypothetical protein KJ956_14055 [Actinobacteria bacterium]|nr:hypothetical protein [Actinomycetota bacterium]